MVEVKLDQPAFDKEDGQFARRFSLIADGVGYAYGKLAMTAEASPTARITFSHPGEGAKDIIGESRVELIDAIASPDLAGSLIREYCTVE